MPTGLQKEIVKRLRLFNKGKLPGNTYNSNKRLYSQKYSGHSDTTAQQFSSTELNLHD